MLERAPGRADAVQQDQSRRIGLLTDAFIRGLNNALFRWRETGEPS